jgi:DNA-binding transcriptional LysR family regulator
MVNLVEEGIDLAVRIGVLRDSMLVAKRLGITRRVLVASPGYLERYGRPKRPADLSQHRTILVSGLFATAEWRFREGRRDKSVRITPAFSTNSGEISIEHARAGAGIARALAYQVRELVHSGELEVLLAAFEQPAIPIHAVYPSGRFLPRRVRAMLDMMAVETAWDFTELAVRRAQRARRN